ncbi:MAG: hypothetical protein ACTS6G_05345 [Candidatus Hodgkinia cicadicola]
MVKVTKINRKVPLYKGKLVDGTVVFKTKEFALVDIGFTQNAILLDNGSWGFKHLAEKEVIKVYVELINEEEAIVSRRTLDEDEMWNKLERLYEAKAEVEAEIVGFNRKGIRLDAYGAFGEIFWTKELIEFEIELRNKSTLLTRIKSVCKIHNIVVLTPAHELKITIGRSTSLIVWTGLIDLCDRGIWTHVDACNGIMILSGRPWCWALNLINRLPFGEIVLSNFVKMEIAPKPLRTSDYSDLIINFIAEIDDALNWDRNICLISEQCVWKWITSLTLQNRNRWCDWKSHNERIVNDRFIEKRFVNFDESTIFSETLFELCGINIRQNLIWNVERPEVIRLLCGFDYKKFRTTVNILKSMKGNRFNSNDKAWCERINEAWLVETNCTVKHKTILRLQELSLNKRGQILKYLRNRTKDSVWKRELDWENEQKLIGKTEIALVESEVKKEENSFSISQGRKRFEGERRKEEAKSINSYLERLNLRGDDKHHNEGESDGKVFKNETNGKTVLNKRVGKSLVDMERELDNKWNENWHLEREQNYWNCHYTETDCSLIETNYENWNGIRLLKSVYAVIIGVDIQALLLVAAVTNKLLTYICDYSFTNDDVNLLQKGWKTNLVFRVTPIALNYSLNDILVAADIESYKHLNFVVENIGLSLIGNLSKIETNCAIVTLPNETYGRLRFNKTSDNFKIVIGMEVDVMVTDFNPITNDINLELTEDESTRTILVETLGCFAS